MRWEELGKLCSIKSGGTPSRKQNDFWRGEIPWAKISDLDTPDGGPLKFTEERISSQGLEAIRNRIFPVGTILLAIYGSVGKTAVLGVESSCNQAILGIQIQDAKALDAEYLLFWLRSIGEKLMSQAKGVAQKNISLKQVKELKIPVPPLEEQRRIAGILDEADLVRKKTQALIDKYDELAQSLFLDMFGDPVTNPKGWEVKSLGSLLELINGRAYKKDELLDNGTPVLRIQNLNGGDRWYYSNLKLAPNKYCYKGDLLFAWSASFGPYIYHGPKAIFHYHIWNCRIKNRDQIPFYFQLLKQLTAQIRSNAHGASMLHMTKGGMEQMKIIVPPDSAIQEFVNKKGISEDQLQSMRTQSDRSERLFRALLQKAFNGSLT